jgi:hypothetical protein
VDDPSDVVVIADESRRAQEVVDVDPADPLLAGADATAESELGEVDETVEGGRAVIEDDPGAHDDEPVGGCVSDCLLPRAGDA